MTKLHKKGIQIQHKPISLSPEEELVHQDYRNAGELTARHAIWQYVESDLPIPNELKPILLELLQSNFKGKSKSITKDNWTILVKEVEFLMLGIHIDGVARDPLTQQAALELTANSHQITYESLEREYKKKIHRRLKDLIRSIPR